MDEKICRGTICLSEVNKNEFDSVMSDSDDDVIVPPPLAHPFSSTDRDDQHLTYFHADWSRQVGQIDLASPP